MSRGDEMRAHSRRASSGGTGYCVSQVAYSLSIVSPPSKLHPCSSRCATASSAEVLSVLTRHQRGMRPAMRRSSAPLRSSSGRLFPIRSCTRTSSACSCDLYFSSATRGGHALAAWMPRDANNRSWVRTSNMHEASVGAGGDSAPLVRFKGLALPNHFSRPTTSTLVRIGCRVARNDSVLTTSARMRFAFPAARASSFRSSACAVIALMEPRFARMSCSARPART